MGRFDGMFKSKTKKKSSPSPGGATAVEMQPQPEDMDMGMSSEEQPTDQPSMSFDEHDAPLPPTPPSEKPAVTMRTFASRTSKPWPRVSGHSSGGASKKVDKKILRRQKEIDGEEAALDEFRRRISRVRESVNPYASRAQGWDYINWKPYGWQRYAYNPDEYIQTCVALAPYVRSVLESGCVGSREKRWEALTGGKSGEGLYSRTMSQSRLASRAGSQSSLTNIGRT